jgi:hypothetical protein
MQSSYQYHFGTGGAPALFGGGGLWGDAGAQGQPGGFSIGTLVTDVGVHEKAASSVKEYAYTEDKNFRFRPAMEDSKAWLMRCVAYSIKDKVGNDPNCGIFAVFDGHGGRQVADHCAERVAEELIKEIKKTSGDLSQAIEGVFLKVRLLQVMLIDR